MIGMKNTELRCVHGQSMGLICNACRQEAANAHKAASQAKPYEATDKVEAIEFSEIPTHPTIDAENSMAIATRELAESIAHLAPAVSALAAAFNGSKPVGVDGKSYATATNIRAPSSTGSVIGDGLTATEMPCPTRGPLTDHEFSAFCELVGYVAVEKQPIVRETINAILKWRGIL